MLNLCLDGGHLGQLGDINDDLNRIFSALTVNQQTAVLIDNFKSNHALFDIETGSERSQQSILDIGIPFRNGKSDLNLASRCRRSSWRRSRRWSRCCRGTGREADLGKLAADVCCAVCVDQTF
jgi:hypothetical protein